MNLRLKAVIEAGLIRSGIPRLAVRLHGRDVLVLAYHNIVPEGDQPAGDASLHLPQRAFAAQLDALRRTHDVVPLAAVLTAGGGRPRAVITFDDAYRGAMTAGIQELASRGLPATVFVAPAYVGDGIFWWDALAASGGLPAKLRSTALEDLAGRNHLIREWAAEHGFPTRALPAHARCASEAELRQAVSRPGITLASHSWSHPNLARLPETELQEELERPAGWLAERFPDAARWLAYPYGLHSWEVEAAAERAGYLGAFRISGGYHRSGSTAGARNASSDRYRLPRLNVPAGVSSRGFRLRTSGLLAG